MSGREELAHWRYELQRLEKADTRGVRDALNTLNDVWSFAGFGDISDDVEPLLDVVEWLREEARFKCILCEVES